MPSPSTLGAEMIPIRLSRVTQLSWKWVHNVDRKFFGWGTNAGVARWFLCNASEVETRMERMDGNALCLSFPTHGAWRVVWIMFEYGHRQWLPATTGTTYVWAVYGIYITGTHTHTIRSFACDDKIEFKFNALFWVCFFYFRRLSAERVVHSGVVGCSSSYARKYGKRIQLQLSWNAVRGLRATDSKDVDDAIFKWIICAKAARSSCQRMVGRIEIDIIEETRYKPKTDDRTTPFFITSNGFLAFLFRRMFDLRQLKQMSTKKSSLHNWHFFHFSIGISSFIGIKKDKFQMAAAHSASAADKKNRNFINSGKAFRDYWKNVMASWLTHAEAIQWIILPARRIRKNCCVIVSVNRM